MLHCVPKATGRHTVARHPGGVLLWSATSRSGALWSGTLWGWGPMVSCHVRRGTMERYPRETQRAAGSVGRRNPRQGQVGKDPVGQDRIVRPP
eukprot:5644302-Pyramimonas_sp.AAC.1